MQTAELSLRFHRCVTWAADEAADSLVLEGPKWGGGDAGVRLSSCWGCTLAVIRTLRTICSSTGLSLKPIAARMSMRLQQDSRIAVPSAVWHLNFLFRSFRSIPRIGNSNARCCPTFHVMQLNDRFGVRPSQCPTASDRYGFCDANANELSPCKAIATATPTTTTTTTATTRVQPHQCTIIVN